MKPVSIEFACFGPYMARQFVDFAQLERNGLFLICGETGAGKTTILDAMCAALYGRASGEARGELGDMRCKLAGPADETRVELVFDNGGRRYRFLRSLRLTRGGNPVEEHQCLELRGGDWRPLLANAKKTAVNAMAEQIIGLTYDQFRQVIILPQGQFERLLTSRSEEKEEILTKLFHAERWERAVKEVSDRVEARDAALRQEQAQIAAKLAEHGCACLEELTQRAQAAAGTLLRLEADTEAAKQTARVRRERQKQALLDDKQFRDLAAQEEKYAALSARREAMEQEHTLVRLADEAERLRPAYEACERAAAALKTAQAAASSARERQRKAADRLEAARRACQTHEEERPACERLRQRRAQLESARQLYASLGVLKARFDRCSDAWERAKSVSAQAAEAFSAADESWRAALARLERAEGEHVRALAAYRRGVSGELARQLVPGKPCPVCGGTEHPSPAPLGADHVTEAQLDALDKAVQRAQRAVSAAKDERDRTEAAKSAAAEAEKAAMQDFARAESPYQHALAQRLEGVGTSAELERQLAAANRRIEAFEKEETAAAEALRASESACQLAEADGARLETELARARDEHDKALSAWTRELENSPIADEAQYSRACMRPEERQRRQARCAEFKAELKSAWQALDEMRGALGDKPRPDMKQAEAAVKAADDALAGLQARSALAEREKQALEAALAELTVRKARHDEARAEADRDLDFARKLRGSAGVSLQRYVLGVNLAAVTAAANRLLETVYGGRYRLYRSDEASGRTLKKGLELEVYDTAQNERRSVNTLSGGEKFLVALSLAIGLSEVVRAGGGGVHMEAMFVDEGFGSLDDAAVDDAVQILHGVRRSAGAVVGVISHVGRLEEIIPTKLEVRKGKNGSTIAVRA